MILYNATSMPLPRPRAGVLDNGRMWPGGMPRTQLPTDAGIRAALNGLKQDFGGIDCEFHVLDDSHGLNNPQKAELLWRIKQIGQKPIAIYGHPGTTAARNLILPWLVASWADVTWTEAKDFALKPVWGPPDQQKRPLADFVDYLCPSMYFMPGMNALVEKQIDPFTAWSLVAEHVLGATRMVASLASGPAKPIYPFLNLHNELRIDPAQRVTPEQIIHFLELRGITGAVVWSDSEMNVALR